MHRRVWKSELLFPAYLSALSIALLLLRSLVASNWFNKLWIRIRRRNKADDLDLEPEVDESVVRTHAGIIADVKAHIKAEGGWRIFGWKLLRLAGCLTLVGLTIASLVIDEENRESSVIDILKFKKGKGKKKKKKDAPVSDEFSAEEWTHVALCLTYVRFKAFAKLLASTELLQSVSAIRFVSGIDFCRCKETMVQDCKHTSCFHTLNSLDHFCLQRPLAICYIQSSSSRCIRPLPVA